MQYELIPAAPGKTPTDDTEPGAFSAISTKRFVTREEVLEANKDRRQRIIATYRVETEDAISLQWATEHGPSENSIVARTSINKDTGEVLEDHIPAKMITSQMKWRRLPEKCNLITIFYFDCKKDCSCKKYFFARVSLQETSAEGIQLFGSQ